MSTDYTRYNYKIKIEDTHLSFEFNLEEPIGLDSHGFVATAVMCMAEQLGVATQPESLTIEEATVTVLRNAIAIMGNKVNPFKDGNEQSDIDL